MDFVLDAEILSTRALVARRIGSSGFVLAGASWNLASDGRLDDFLNAYHDVFGVSVLGRRKRPENSFGYQIDFKGGDFEYEEAVGFFGDLRVGAGLRHHRHWQSVLTVTLPTGSEPAGYRKGVPSANLTTTFHREFGAEGRFAYEGTFGVGYTPRNGDLGEWQRTTFGLLTQGARARLLGPWHAYANFLLATPYYRDSGIPELDANEFGLDLGTLFHFASGHTCFPRNDPGPPAERSRRGCGLSVRGLLVVDSANGPRRSEF